MAPGVRPKLGYRYTIICASFSFPSKIRCTSVKGRISTWGNPPAIAHGPTYDLCSCMCRAQKTSANRIFAPKLKSTPMKIHS